ncbi:MAG: GTP-binding protein [Porticoccaceae bacterium]|nr:GTP-binding protein [Porticoccaceae bacterium]
MIPVTVITGFLGSGKTTLISRLLQSPDLSDTAVIVNEFGETDLDHTLIAASSENILQLMNGCICCTIREDLALELRNLYLLRTLGDVPCFNRVLIETTGLADPVPIIHTFMANTQLKKAYRMHSVVTVVDAVAGVRTLNDQDVSRRQVALADQLLISKLDIVNEHDMEELRSKLIQINPAGSINDASVFSVADLTSSNHYPLSKSGVDIDSWLGDVHASGHGAHVYGATGHSSSIQIFNLHREQAISLADLVLFFQELVNYQPDKLLRVKGLVAVAGKTSTPAVVHGIRDKVYPLVWLKNWPETTKPGLRLVFITDDIEKQEIEHMLKTMCGI